MKRIPFCFFIFLILTACKEKNVDVNVYVNSEFIGNNKVVIDDTLILKKNDCTNTYCMFILKSGEHTLSINNTKVKLEIGNKGGILNVDHQDFVIFPIRYSSKNNTIANAIVNIDLPIIIDSLIIYEKTLAPNQTDLVELLNKKSFREFVNIDKIQKINKDQLFINKTWDYDMYENSPDTIESQYVAEDKKKIAKAELFLIYAKLSDEYIVETIKKKELIELIRDFKKD